MLVLAEISVITTGIYNIKLPPERRNESFSVDAEWKEPYSLL